VIRRAGIAALLVFAVTAAPVRAPAGSPPGPDPVDAARAFRSAHGAAILAEFADLLAHPNHAADSVGIAGTVAFLTEHWAARGVRLEALTLPGVPPLLTGEVRVPGATRTLGIYVHYDGQPVDSTQWTFGPWAATLTDRPLEAGGRAIPFPESGDAVDPEWRIYARSAGDDKAPFPALWAAFDALAGAGIAPTSNIRFLFEGEEEAGSTHLEEYLTRYRDRLEADIWLFCDGPVHVSRRPQLVFGVRGVTGLTVTVYGPARSLHSGHYGNWAPVPGQLLASLLASMKDAEGNVLIPGFYDTVTPLGEAERRALAALPDDDDALRAELGLTWTEGGGAPLAERILLPSLTVKGMASGNVGALTRNVIPSTAVAELGIRLVQGNDPDHMLDLVEAHIAAQGFTVTHQEPDLAFRQTHRNVARVERNGGYPAARTSMDEPLARQVIAAATRAAGGETPLLVPGLGGSLPLYLFTGLLGKPAVIVPIANHDDNQHAPDENLRLANLWYGVDLMTAILTLE